MPGDMIETRPQMVDDLAGQDGKTNRNRKVSVIIHSPLPFPRTWIGHDWIFAPAEEGPHLGVEISDALFGPPQLCRYPRERVAGLVFPWHTLNHRRSAPSAYTA